MLGAKIKKLRRVILLTLIFLAFFQIQKIEKVMPCYNPFRISTHLIEMFGVEDLNRQRLPVKKLEKSLQGRVGGIYYLIKDLPQHFIPNEYGNKRWKYLRQKLLKSDSTGVPLTVVDTQHVIFGWGRGETESERDEDWIKIVSSEIHSSKCYLIPCTKSVLFSRIGEEYQVIFYFNLHDFPYKDMFKKYRYLLLLVADELHIVSRWGRETIFENVAYDFIPLEGDDPKTFDGSGLPLESQSRKDLSKEPILVLKTAPFKLPEVKGNPGWSLHLILENPEHLGKTIFSYKIRLLNY